MLLQGNIELVTIDNNQGEKIIKKQQKIISIISQPEEIIIVLAGKDQ